MSNSIQKKIHRQNKRVEEGEIKRFDREYARIIQAFNDFMFGNGSGSFIQFDAEYRKLAEKEEYKYLKVDKLEFYNLFINNDTRFNNISELKFNFPISFEKASNTRNIQ